MKKTAKTRDGSNGSNATKGQQGRRFTPEQREHALRLVASEVLTRTAIATLLGTTPESVRRWVKEADTKAKAGQGVASSSEAKAVTEVVSSKARANGRPRSPYAPTDPGSGLGKHEVAAIVELKQQQPSMGPAQIRAQLKRFKGWRVSNKAIARVLKKEGYEPVHRGSRPQGPEPIRFEAPRRNALWQLDFTEVRVGRERLQVLVILDDFSRYVVAHAMCDSPTTEVATETLKAAIARHGKPEAVRSDRGGAFVAFTKETDFGRYLEAELIDHIVGRSYSPKGGGKVESAIGTLKRELWQVFEFEDRSHAAEQLSEFFAHYNERRAHMGIDGLTPADRFFGRADRVLAAVDAISRKRQGALALLDGSGMPLEELGRGAPMEVLRLVLVDGVMELRFCGSRVRLGVTEN